MSLLERIAQVAEQLLGITSSTEPSSTEPKDV